jgi:uncharacterized protein (TIGR00251 family)
MIVEVTVAPRSKGFSVSVKDGKVRICLRSPPEGNKANLELIKELSKALKAEVHIISGHTSRRKRLELSVSEDEWAAFLAGHGR